MAKLLAAEQGVPLAEREEYFVAGLLHDLGKVPFGDEYAEVLKTAKKEATPLKQVEQEMMNIDHEEVGQMIASKWKLNSAITDAICHHHEPEEAQKENRDLVATVALADFYVCLFDIGYAGNRYPDETQLELLLKLCGLDWETVAGLSDAVDAEISKAEIFLQV
jgi:HD-like signal output (HDOD) protein